MTKYICLKHGELKANGEDRIMWAGSLKRWCRYCFEEMLNRHCAEMMIIDEEKDLNL